MALQVRSSAKGAERRRAAFVRIVICLCVLLCPLSQFASAYRQTKPSRQAGDRFRFQVTDSENHLPIPEAAVSLVYWQKKATTEGKKEIEVMTDKNGIAEFRRLDADKLAVSVTAKGYRSYWRWVGPTGTEELIHIRLEKWANKVR